VNKKRTWVKIIAIASIFIAASAAALLLKHLLNRPEAFETTIHGEDVFIPQPRGIRIEAWVEGLEVPWSLIFLDEKTALVSERPGRIRLIREGKLRETPYAELDVHHAGEGGLMGLAAHPRFPQKPFIYAMYTYREGGDTFNKVVKLQAGEERASFAVTIIERIPGGRFHNGGRLAFGPDGFLYITTGEIFRADLAQDLDNLGGKVLRVDEDGNIPKDNPFPGSPVFTYGHRNPQGLAWHPETGTLFSSEHGPSGEFGLRAYDEINILKPGRNYGWPEVVGIAGKEEYEDPLVVWPAHAVPPGGMTFRNNDLFVATLRSRALVRILLERQRGHFAAKRIERWFAEDYDKGRYGRLRDVVKGPDGALYFLTSNRDGRGAPNPGDDKIYRILFEK
jgi:glucose/arabinose dehydrogenase